MDEITELLLELRHYSSIQALAVVLLSVVVAKISDWLLTKGLTRLTEKTATDIDDQVLGMLHKPIFYSVLLAGFSVAITLIDPPPPFDFIAFGFIKTAVVLIWLALGIRLGLLVLDWMTQHPERFHVVQADTKPLFDMVTKVLLIGGALYFVLISWGVNVTAWLASAGILGLAVGFAAKDTLANLFAGVFILADAPYKIGDFIVLDGGERGQVTKIGIRSTRMLTRDDIEITIPNATIANSKIINESGGPYVKYRNRIAVGVAYGSDVDVVKKVLLDVAKAAIEAGQLSPSPEPRVRFRDFGDFALLFELLYWIEDPVLRGRVQDWLNTSIYKALGKAGIEIPYPKRDLYLKQMPERKDSH
ncbi:mechanosensitive ion channel family protein [Acidobacteria bacterium AH-259-D05]|nr:mechanosensitive ion channel family protein [Acidobacteria bacterium AH-259-D05]